MTAHYLLILFDSAYLFALAAWVGSILFFSFAVAPVIFSVLGSEAGARFVRALFPRYYLWGAISGAIALPSMVAVPLCFPEYRGPMVGAQALAIIGGTLIMLYAGNVLTPAINQARDAGPAGEQRFRRLHRRSVGLNGVVMVIGLALLVGFARRPAPRTPGIVEKTPIERLRYDAAVSRVMRAAEVKYGLRPATEGDTPTLDEGPVIDPETVQEIDAIYAAKAARDLARARRGGSPGATTGSPLPPGGHESATATPGSGPPARTGEPGVR